MPTLQDKPVGHTATVKRPANTPIKAYSPPAMRNVSLPEPRPVGHTATLNVMQTKAGAVGTGAADSNIQPEHTDASAAIAAYKVIISAPEDAGEAGNTWNGMKPLDLKTLKRFWILASPESPKLELKNVVFAEWTDLCGFENYGMKQRDSGLEHGTVRSVQPGELVSEGTFRNGQVHGLKREVGKNHVRVSLFQDAIEQAYFCFGRNFVETERGGPKRQMIEDINAEMFRF